MYCVISWAGDLFDEAPEVACSDQRAMFAGALLVVRG